MNDRSSSEFSPRFPKTVALLAFALIVIAAGIFYIVERKEQTPTVSEQPSFQSATDEEIMAQLADRVEYALPIARIVDGIVEEGSETLEVPTTKGQITFNIDPEFPQRIDARYLITIEEYGGEELYGVWIPDVYLERGNIPLNLDGKIFVPGKYRIEVTEEGSDSVSTAVAEAMFEILE